MTILAVEDEPSVLVVVRITLERAGYEVLTATSAQQAIAISIEHADSIQLLVLDVIMPELSGPQLRERLLHHLGKPDIPTVFTSGYPDVFCEPDLAILQKPFTGADLLDSVQRALNGGFKKSPGSEQAMRAVNRRA